MQMTTSWGMTETSPPTTAHFPITRSDCLGVPLPGVELALVPVAETLELRVRGPNVTPGYHRRPDLAAAFDDDGYLRTGDAVALSPRTTRPPAWCSAAASPRTSSSPRAPSSASAPCAPGCSRPPRASSPTR